jgi:hypothetical protein
VLAQPGVASLARLPNVGVGSGRASATLSFISNIHDFAAFGLTSYTRMPGSGWAGSLAVEAAL